MSRTRSASFIAPFVALAVLAAMTKEVPSALAQTPSFTLIGIPAGYQNTKLTGLSADGTRASGWGDADKALLWSVSAGINSFGRQGPPFGQYGYGISGDGQVVVGDTTGFHAMRWTAATGTQDIGTLPGYLLSEGHDANQDGSIVVGTCLTVPNGTPQAFRWTQSGGMVGLGVGTTALAISGDGGTIVGNQGSAPNGFRWTQAGGIQLLPSLGGVGNAQVGGVNFDGSIIVGNSGTAHAATMWVNGVPLDLSSGGAPGIRLGANVVNDAGTVVAGLGQGSFGTTFAGVWTPATGISRLSDYLTANGVTLPAGVELATCTAISADGRTFAGYIVGSQALPIQGFVATIAPPCPADLDNDGDFSNGGTRDHAVTIDDLLYFLAAFELGNLAADLDNGTGIGTHDGAVTVEDLLFFLAHFEQGC